MLLANVFNIDKTIYCTISKGGSNVGKLLTKPQTLLSEGLMTLHSGWTTARGSFGTIVCGPTGKKDLFAYALHLLFVYYSTYCTVVHFAGIKTQI